MNLKSLIFVGFSVFIYYCFRGVRVQVGPQIETQLLDF